MEVSNDYVRDFDPEWFLEAYYRSVDNDRDGNTTRFLLDSLHSIFSSDFDFGRRLLDVGSGPTVLSVLSASRRLQHIDLSDFTPRNLDVLRDWKSGKRCELSSLMEYEMKLSGDSRSISEREDALKSLVQNIYHIDVRMEEIFLDAASPDEGYDVITSCFCLESVSNEKDIYKESVQNISRLLKKGGYLVLLGGIEESCYRVGNTVFQVTSLQEKEIKSIYKEYGFIILEWFTIFQGNTNLRSGESNISDYQNVFAMLAQKRV